MRRPEVQAPAYRRCRIAHIRTEAVELLGFYLHAPIYRISMINEA